MYCVSRCLQTKNRRFFSLFLGLLLAGCSAFDGFEYVDVPQPTEVATPKPVIIPEPKLTLSPAKPQPKIPTVQPVLTPMHVAVVMSDDTPPYQGIVTQMTKWMEGRDYALYNLDGNLADAEQILSRIADRNTTAIVAVGLRAALLTSQHSSKPVIFCQVFNYEANGLLSDKTKGVASIPPLANQLELWREVNPEMHSVGAILGEGHDDLIQEATKVSAARDIEFHHRRASSDKEALYQFKRLAPAIDGFWLFPDNRILSGPVIGEILSYALRHRVQVTVFTPTLLSHGAYMSAESSDADIALTILSILDQVGADRFDDVPSVTPLSEAKITWSDSGPTPIAGAQ